MSKLKEYYPDKAWIKYSLFIAFTATLLYALYFIIKNLDRIALTGLEGLSSILSALTPLFIGLILAYLLGPLVEIINKKAVSKIFFKQPSDPLKAEKFEKRKRLISVLFTYLIILMAIAAIIYGFSVLILGQFIFSGINTMVDGIINYISTYEENIRQWSAMFSNASLTQQVQDLVNSVMIWLSNHFSATTAIQKITTFSGNIISFAIGTIISIYILMDRDFFLRLWRKTMHLLLPQKANAILTETLYDINTILSAFIRGALLDSLFIAILSSIGLSIVGLDFAVFIGCFAGIANVIPYFGPVLGMIPAFIVGTFTESLATGVISVITLLFIQQIDANLIYPRVVGSSTGLHPLFVLLAVSVAGYYGGILGMILAVPIAGILQTFILKWVHSHEMKLADQAEQKQ
ncbi:AI-2E family transporter [Clostridium aminobutyricum]|uniref:AI-2E family transporter n=1 Tax=Clostridium aminobutyricum TaxID=33953 RepID=A0A939IHN6_CLOAM|nr:AI-2E family transporter [Clostridium aminobutyricum]MBN7774012.1 AI-2E family transporter [Clostridium aminobutyricum]